MSTEDWRPDDSLQERNEQGEVRGVRRIKDALEKHGVRYGDRIITSQDEGIAEVQRELERIPMPPGVEQWLVPIALGAGEDILVFMARFQPNATVPEHSHTDAQFRIVIEGSVRSAGKELKAGDWMLVPAGKSYSLEAGPDGCIMLHPYLPWPWEWWPW